MPKDNKIEMPAGRPERGSDNQDFSSARENLDRLANRPREFEKLRNAQVPEQASDSQPSASPTHNDQLDKFYNDIDEKKRGDIQKIINVVFEKGPEEGVFAARVLNDPYILDEIEKLLTTDWMHKILLERGLLKESN